MPQEEVGVEMQTEKMTMPTILLYSLEKDKLRKDSEIRIDLYFCYHHEQTRAYQIRSFYYRYCHINANLNPKDSYQPTDVGFIFPTPSLAPHMRKHCGRTSYI